MLSYMREKVTGKFTYKIPPDWEPELDAIADETHRTRSDVARMLLRRGMGMYYVDKRLYETTPSPKGKAATDGGKKERESRVS